MLDRAGFTFLELAVTALIIGLILGTLFALVFSLTGREQAYLDKLKVNIYQSLGISIPVVLVGLVAGYLTGTSRSPVVGTIIPAVLALFGGLNIYCFGVESKNRVLVGYSIFIFTLVLFYGVQVGINDRENGRVARLITLSEQEKQIRAYRQNRDLAEEPPNWILGGEPR